MKRRALLGSSLVGLSVAASTASAQAAKTSQKDNSLKTPNSVNTRLYKLGMKYFGRASRAQ